MILKHILFPPELVKAADKIRGDVPFAVFVRRALEREVGALRPSPRVFPEASEGVPFLVGDFQTGEVSDVVLPAQPVQPSQFVPGAVRNRPAKPRRPTQNDCVHPVSRRIGSACGICGAKA